MIFTLIDECKHLLKHYQALDKEGDRTEDISEAYHKIEKGLQDILKNCIHVVNLREKGIVSELIICINHYYLVPESVYSSQKIVAVYIEMINILVEIDNKQVLSDG